LYIQLGLHRLLRDGDRDQHRDARLSPRGNRRTRGLAAIRSLESLREAILEGAIHRLRPKLLTEGTTLISIAPMFWATGVGAEVVRPMAAPVLGGLLIADEVIDVFLPVLHFAVQEWRWRRLHPEARREGHQAEGERAPCSPS
jgi:hypothetical protein